ncbi:MAG: hypothetical protein K1T65_00580 [Candidatus Aramenus sp.]|nr:hypothetical protein [Candidatus Aramenus sp.]
MLSLLEIAKVSGSLALIQDAQAELVNAPLRKYLGSRISDDLASGKVIGSFALSEPCCGSDAKAMKDEEFFAGRSDDVVKVSGKRIGPGEIEAVIDSHPFVVESACVGVPDKVKGEVLMCFVVPKASKEGLEVELLEYLEKKLGKALVPSRIILVRDLPRTRNGKIMRRLIRNALLGKELGDTSSLENPQSLEEIKRAVKGS